RPRHDPAALDRCRAPSRAASFVSKSFEIGRCRSASVESDERIRLFCALRLPGNVLDALADWQLEHVGGGRPVARENLHVTLAFLGHRPGGDVEAVVADLRAAAAAARPLRFEPRGYRETRSVGMLVLD